MPRDRINVLEKKCCQRAAFELNVNFISIKIELFLNPGHENEVLEDVIVKYIVEEFVF